MVSKIQVTRPYLPPLEELLPLLHKIWDSRVLTNGGPLHAELERELCDYLGVPYVALVNNGTLALILALKAADLSGEVITTPFTFVATANALRWCGLDPVFVDIDPHTMNIDPHRVRAAITEKTSAILAVHVYGNPCDVDELEKIATENNLKLIYDSAHAFGVRCHCGSVLKHGDLSVMSFHATKVFNTFEGGAIVCKDAQLKSTIDRLKNFGLVSENELIGIGLNAKMSELNAAVGLIQLRHVDQIIATRRAIHEAYCAALEGCEGIQLPKTPIQINSNYAYFPILVRTEYPLSRDELATYLSQYGIYTRKYFYPLVTDFKSNKRYTFATNADLQNAKNVSERVLCLPIYPDLTKQVITQIANLIKNK